MRKSILLAALCALVAVLVPATANAKTVLLHTLGGSFNGADAVGAAAPFGAYTLERIGVDESTGAVIVASHEALYRFTAAGVSQPFSAVAPKTTVPEEVINEGALAVDNSGGATQGRIYSFSRGEVLRAHEASGGVTEGRFPIGSANYTGQTCGVSVDSQGNIWRHSNGDPLLEFNGQGEQIASVPIENEDQNFCQFDMDEQGNFYAVMGYSSGRVKEFSPTGHFLRYIDENSPGVYLNSVAVDRSNGDIYLDSGSEIEHFNAAGEFIESFGSLVSSHGLAVNSVTHTVYATSEGENTSVDIFTSSGPATVGFATTEEATEVKRTSALLHGKLNPEGVATTACKFEYRFFNPETNQNTTFQKVDCGQGNVFTGNAEQTVSATPTNLIPEREYQVRLAVTNANGTAYGHLASFKTPAAVKAAMTEAPTAITRVGATLNGSFDPDGLDTHYYFEYGEYPFGKVPATPTDAGSGSGTVHVSVPVTGLAPGNSNEGNRYEVRLVAENETGRTVGETLVFHTLPAVLGVTTLPASALTKTGATLNGSFEPGGLDTHYYFEWGLNTGYGRFAPVPPPGVDGGSGTGVVTVSAPLTKLELGKIYHYRLVAVNAQFGTTYGADESFIPAEGPTITVDRATEINTDTAALEATINPNSRATTYHWEYGTENCAVSACTQTAPVTIPAGTAGVPVRTVIEGLTPGATYHFRLLAENELGAATGEDHYFITFTAESGVDPCPNVLVRKQTGAAATAHCRAYELVSAANTSGYDVESNLIAGSEPLPGFPDASNRALYTLRFGGLTGLGDPPNRGGDPYLATRGPEGWTTTYVGLSATATPSARPFSSTLAEADGSLDTFAFGGPETCAPCFPDGSTNMPLRIAGRRTRQGHGGRRKSARRTGRGNRQTVLRRRAQLRLRVELAVRAGRQSGQPQHLRAEPLLRHHPGRLDRTGRVDDGRPRDRRARRLRRRLARPDRAGSRYRRRGQPALRPLYARRLRPALGRRRHPDRRGPLRGHDRRRVDRLLHHGGSARRRHRLGSRPLPRRGHPDRRDRDPGLDRGRRQRQHRRVHAGRRRRGQPLERARRDVAGELRRGRDRRRWGSRVDCGHRLLPQPGAAERLRRRRRRAEPLRRRAGIGAGLRRHALDRRPAGERRRRRRGGAGNRRLPDHPERDDRGLRQLPGPGRGDHRRPRRDLPQRPRWRHLLCLLHPDQRLADPRHAVDRERPQPDERRPRPLHLGRQLVLRDTNQLRDAYEWDEGRVSLISTGLDVNDSSLLTASADGTDAFFFTRQNLAPHDETGGAMKIYDAREGGGFLYDPPSPPCVASDECHGPGTQSAPPPPINTIEGTGKKQPTDVKAQCAKGKVKKGKKCVKRPTKKKHPKKHRHHGKKKGRKRG